MAEGENIVITVIKHECPVCVSRSGLILPFNADHNSRNRLIVLVIDQYPAMLCSLRQCRLHGQRNHRNGYNIMIHFHCRSHLS